MVGTQTVQAGVKELRRAPTNREDFRAGDVAASFTSGFTPLRILAVRDDGFEVVGVDAAGDTTSRHVKPAEHVVPVPEEWLETPPCDCVEKKPFPSFGSRLRALCLWLRAVARPAGTGTILQNRKHGCGDAVVAYEGCIVNNQQPRRRRGAAIAFVSHRGGVGRLTLATHASRVLAERGRTALVVGSGAGYVPTVPAVHVVDATTRVPGAPMERLRRCGETLKELRPQCDYVVIDIPSGVDPFNDDYLSLLGSLDRVLLVTRAKPLHLADSLEMLEGLTGLPAAAGPQAERGDRVAYDRISVVANLVEGELGEADLVRAETYPYPFAGTVPSSVAGSWLGRRRRAGAYDAGVRQVIDTVFGP